MVRCNYDCFHCRFPDCINSDPISVDERTMMDKFDFHAYKEESDNWASKKAYQTYHKCSRCGKSISDMDAHKMCKDCRELHNRRQRERRIKLSAEGRCQNCGSEIEFPLLTGILCESCYLKRQKKREQLKKEKTS